MRTLQYRSPHVPVMQCFQHDSQQKKNLQITLESHLPPRSLLSVRLEQKKKKKKHESEPTNRPWQVQILTRYSLAPLSFEVINSKCSRCPWNLCEILCYAQCLVWYRGCYIHPRRRRKCLILWGWNHEGGRAGSRGNLFGVFLSSATLLLPSRSHTHTQHATRAVH